MAILKNRTQGNYVTVSQAVMHDKRLGITERGLFVTLLSLPDEWNLSIKGLQCILPDGREKLTSALNHLIELGYITMYQDRASGKFANNIYEINEMPVVDKNENGESILPFTGNPHTVKPVTAKPSTEKPQPENPQQVNNKDTNNKESNNKKVNNKESGSDELSPEQYDLLVNEFGKAVVDQQIKKIKERHYKGCYDYLTIRQWCLERREYPSMVSNESKKNAFNSFPQNTYDFEELERRLVVNY